MDQMQAAAPLKRRKALLSEFSPTQLYVVATIAVYTDACPATVWLPVAVAAAQFGLKVVRG
jgi:hypothetical protein